MILVDAHSKWLKVFPMSNITAKAVVKTLRFCYARFLLPILPVSDQGRQFECEIFQDFLSNNNIKLN